MLKEVLMHTGYDTNNKLVVYGVGFGTQKIYT